MSNLEKLHEERVCDIKEGNKKKARSVSKKLSKLSKEQERER